MSWLGVAFQPWCWQVLKAEKCHQILIQNPTKRFEFFPKTWKTILEDNLRKLQESLAKVVQACLRIMVVTPNIDHQPH